MHFLFLLLNALAVAFRCRNGLQRYGKFFNLPNISMKIFKIFFRVIKLYLTQTVKAFVVLTTLGRKASAKV
jgi:hypothetical protein